MRISIDRCLPPASTVSCTGQPADSSSMTAYQGFKVFSRVVLALMLAGMAYSGYIAVTYWTGISV